MAEAAALTADEAKIYDRQIRVWGVETQQRLRSAKVLFVRCPGVSAEVMKNIVLAGVGQVTLMDERKVADAEPGNFLIPCDADASATAAAASCNTLKEMNPMVTINTTSGPVDELTDAALADFHVVLMGGGSLRDQAALNARCRKLGVKFFATAVFSAGGYFFTDLVEHTYIEPPKAVKDGAAPPPPEPQTMAFVPMEQALHADHWKKLPRRVSALYLALSALWAIEGKLGRAAAAADVAAAVELKMSLATQAGVKATLLPDSLLEALLTSPAEHPAVASIVGGFLGQEVLKAVSGKGTPLQNFFLYDLASGDGKVEHLQAPAANPPNKKAKVSSQ